MEVGVDVGGEAAGGDAFAAAARGLAGDECSLEAVVAVRSSYLGWDQPLGNRGLDRGLEPFEIDPVGNGVGDVGRRYRVGGRGGDASRSGG